MPGLTFAQSQTITRENRITSLHGVCFRDEYELITHIEDSAAFLGSTGYPEYPVRTVETEDAVFLLEGHLYDVDNERYHLRSVGPHLLSGNIEELADWISNRDGDFIILAYEKGTGSVSLINDIFARLPVYYTTVGNDIVLSRELKFIRDLSHYCNEPLEPDTLAFAQTLLFGYQLGCRTLFNSVRRVPPGSYVQIDNEVQLQRLHNHNFETTTHSERSVRENSRALASLFENACTDRDLTGLSNVLSLSGGLDSRAAAGGFSAVDVPYTAATFEKPNGVNSSDVRLAERIANVLDIDWERYTVERTETNRRELLEMKQGMNFLAMSFLFDFLDQLRSQHGAFTYITGDGGDKVLPDITPPRDFSSQRELAEYIIDVHSIFEMEEAADLADVSRDTLIQMVKSRLDSYPESAFDAQYVHFLIRERGLNWLNQGEDRNRYYCWSVSPFYSTPFFEYAMNVPAEQKRRNRLYAAFLQELDPALCDIKDANYNATVTSLRYKLNQFCVNLITRYPSLKNTISFLLNNHTNGELSERIGREFRRSEKTPLRDQAVAKVIRNGERYDGHELYNLYTLLATSNYTSDQLIQNRPMPMLSDGAGHD